MKASEPAQGICGDSTTLDSVQGETLEKSSTEDKTLLLFNISTKNHLSPLQSSVARLTRHEPDIERASVPTQENTISTNHNGNVPTSEAYLPPNVKTANTSDQSHPPSTVKSNTAAFLCDSNGKFLHKKKLFWPNQELTFFRCPRLKNAPSILQNDLHEIAEIILVHTGTNDLTSTTSIHVFISEFCNLIKKNQRVNSVRAKSYSQHFYHVLIYLCKPFYKSIDSSSANAPNYPTSMRYYMKISSPKNYWTCMMKGM